MTEHTPKQIALAREIAQNIANEPCGAYSNEVYLGALAAIVEVSELAAKMADDQRDVFASDQYAVGQPMSSFGERFACGRIAEAIRNGDHLP